MISCCTDPYHCRWAKYGGAGIQVYEPWKEFEVFRLDMGHRPEGCVLARRDQLGNYTPTNCHWERRADAARYQSSTTLTYRGETLLLAEWSRRTGMPVLRIRGRMVLGWSAGEALGLEPRATPDYKSPAGAERTSEVASPTI